MAPTTNDRDDDVAMGPPLSAELGIDIEDTDFMYGENKPRNDLINTNHDSLLSHIANLDNGDSRLMRKIMDNINSHVSLLLRTDVPQPIMNDHVLRQLNMLATQLGRPNIAEIYSPPRVTCLAQKFGFRPGVALDLTVLDPADGLPWDFTKPQKRARAMALVQQDAPFLLIMSPRCKAFSTLNHINKARLGPET